MIVIADQMKKKIWLMAKKEKSMSDLKHGVQALV